MNRNDMLAALEDGRDPWDVVVIGGGATGLGVAVDAATRGYRTLLLEQDDFAKGTSSRSTKLVHGGVRYLQQGNVSLVLEALRERGLLIRNAPHLVRNLGFIVPNYDWWEGPFYGIGLKVYDMLAGKLGLGPSRWLDREETLERLPTIEREGLRGGVIYHDAQFDDARLAIALARSAATAGATLLNYARVTALVKSNGLISGLRFHDSEKDREHEVRARVVVNATGVFTDDILRMDSPAAPRIIEPSQGIHLVLDKRYHPAANAIMVPRTDDGRVLFAVPWHGRVIVGTTDTEVERAEREPRAREEEVDFLLEHVARYLEHDPTRADVLSVFAGLRPLVRPPDSRDTASISRDHTLVTSKAGLVTITGGKWTTYRKMAQDTVDQAIVVGGLDPRACATEELDLHGHPGADASTSDGPRSFYGSDLAAIDALERERPELAQPLDAALPYRMSEVLWGVRHEMARTVEDSLSRRTRSLLLDARAALRAAPAVAKVMAHELGLDAQWQQDQLAAFTKLSESYRLEWRRAERAERPEGAQRREAPER